jgi:triphosphoribosyl-dephospho-CoA synthase
MLRAARARGAREDRARLDALLSLMAGLDDTCVLHRGGRRGLRAVQRAARGVLDAGGSDSTEGRRRLAELDAFASERRLSPGGAADLLAAALLLDAICPAVAPAFPDHREDPEDPEHCQRNED